MINAEDFTKSHLVSYLWRFRKMESLSGMAAIGCTLRNRVLSGWHSGDWLGVLKEEIDKAGPSSEFPDFRDPVLTRLIWKVEAIFDGTIEDPTNGAKYWCYLPNVSDDFKTKILQRPDEHPRLANLGHLYFFG